MNRGSVPLRQAIPTDERGRVDTDRWLAQINWDNLSEVEKLMLGVPDDFDKMFDEVAADPELARLRWGENDESILHWAAGYGAVKLVRLLINLGADINASSAGERPLHWAAHYDVPSEVALLLLEQGADANAVSLCGWTPLHEAVVNWRFPVVKLLLRQGADMSVKDRWGYTAADWAAIKCYHDVLMELLAKGARVEHPNARASIAASQAEGFLEVDPDETLRLTAKAVAALQKPGHADSAAATDRPRCAE